MADLGLPAGAEIIGEGGTAGLPAGAEIIGQGSTPGLPAGAKVIGGGNLATAPDAAIPPATDQLISDESLGFMGSVGEILDAFGEGASDGWGQGPLGLSPESEQSLSKIGLFNGEGSSLLSPLKSFNQALIRPLAVSIDALLRAGNAGIFGIAKAAGETAEQTGAASAIGLPGERLTRDIIALTDVVGIATGTFGGAQRVRVGKTKDVDVSIGERRAVARAREGTGEEVPPPAREFDQPATEYMDGSGNINLDRIETTDDIKQIISVTSDVEDGFADARRGVITNEQTQDLADSLGMTVTELTDRKIGQAFNAEEAVAARNMLVQSAEKVREMALKSIGKTDADLVEFQQAIARHVAIQEQVAGATAEAGRALQSFRIMAKAKKEAEELTDVISELGGRADIESLARKIRELETPEQTSRFLNEAKKATTTDKVLEAWINALLSGPTTQATNILSNTITAVAIAPLERLGAAVISKGKVIAGKDIPEADRVLLGEAAGKLFGVFQGSVDGVIAGYKSFKTEIPTTPGEKFEATIRKSIKGRLGRVIRVPGRALQAQDEFFKAIGYRQELNALAYRQASSEGLSGRALAARVVELVQAPPKKMSAKASKAGQYQTFTKQLGEPGRMFQSIVSHWPILRIPFTFIRTPVNILKYAGERTVLSVFSKEVRANLSGKRGQAVANEQAARLVTGSGISYMAWQYATDGTITGGGPTDSAERAMMYLSGWQPYSVRVGDMYYSYGRLEPLGVLLGVTADAADIYKRKNDIDLEDLPALITASISKNLISKSWLSGLSDLTQMLADQDRYGDKYIARLVGTAVPTGVAQVARVIDPTMRDAQTLIDTLKSRVPGLSSDVIPKRDIFGRPIVLEGAAGPDLISPIFQSRIDNDPVVQEFLQLGVFPAPLRGQIRGVELSPAQKEDYEIVAGGFMHQWLTSVVATPGWSSMPLFARRDAVTNIVKRSRETARKMMIAKYPNIINEVTESKIKKYQDTENVE